MRPPGLLILLSIAHTIAHNCHASELKPFTTDGCSMWIDGTLDQPNLWRHCCVVHDLDYWQGGSEEQRKKSDERIQACVEEAQGSGMANYMYKNVRWGGSPYLMSKYRWGYGWNYLDGLWPRGYKVLKPEEQQFINQAMPAALQVVAEDAIKHPPHKASSSSNNSASSEASAEFPPM